MLEEHRGRGSEREWHAPCSLILGARAHNNDIILHLHDALHKTMEHFAEL